jgi:hypothetical protein
MAQMGLLPLRGLRRGSPVPATRSPTGSHVTPAICALVPRLPRPPQVTPPQAIKARRCTSRALFLGRLLQQPIGHFHLPSEVAVLLLQFLDALP